MKKILRILLPLILLAITVTILIIACTDDEDVNGGATNVPTDVPEAAELYVEVTGNIADLDRTENPILSDINNYVITINGNNYTALMTLYDLVAHGDFYLASVGSQAGEDGEVFVDDVLDRRENLPRIISPRDQPDAFSFAIVTNYRGVGEGSTIGSLRLMGLRYRYNAADENTVVLPFDLYIGMDMDSVISILGEPSVTTEHDSDTITLTYYTDLVGEIGGSMLLEVWIGSNGLMNLDFVLHAS